MFSDADMFVEEIAITKCANVHLYDGPSGCSESEYSTVAWDDVKSLASKIDIFGTTSLPCLLH